MKKDKKGVWKISLNLAPRTYQYRFYKVYCFLQTADISKDMEVSFVWFHEEKEILKTILPMKMGKRWRTYADKNLRGLKEGWKVEIKGMDGNLLKEIKFKVE